MARGGPRPNAGRKKGSSTKLDATAREQAMVSGISPLDFLLSVMRGDAYEFSSRLDAAKAAAPYVHARLATTTIKGDEDAPLSINVFTGVPRA